MKLSINLLPPEILAQQLKSAKFYKIQTIGVMVILTMIFLASLTIAMRVLQSRNIVEVQAKVTESAGQVSDLKNTQASLFLLSDRLKAISEYWGISSKQTLMYKLIEKLIPPSVVINSISIDKTGEVVFLALAPDSLSLDNLLNNLTTKESNEGKISQVSIDSLNRGRDGLYRVSFKVKP